MHDPSKVYGKQPLRNWKEYDRLSRPYPLKYFKGCLPQILLGPFVNTLSHISHEVNDEGFKSYKGLF